MTREINKTFDSREGKLSRPLLIFPGPQREKGPSRDAFAEKEKSGGVGKL